MDIFHKTVTFTLVLLFFCVFGAVAVSANDGRGLQTKISDSLPDSEFHPELGTYHYDVQWGGIQVGKVFIIIDKEGDKYRVVVSGKTSQKINLLYRAKYRGEVQFDPDPLTPITAEILQKSRKDTKSIHMTFPQRNRVESVEVKKGQNKPPRTTYREFTSDTFILDPFSTLFLVRQLDWHVGMAEVFDIFTGKEKYELRLLCDSVTTLKVGKRERSAWLIMPRLISSKDGKEVKKNTLQVYLARDESREVLRIDVEPQVGTVEVHLKKFVRVSTGL